VAEGRVRGCEITPPHPPFGHLLPASGEKGHEARIARLFESRSLRPILREAAVFLLFVAITVVLTWPLAVRLNTATSDLGDPLLSSWIINWGQYAGLRFPHRIYQAPIFYPAQYPLAFSENMFGIALASLPFYLAGFRALAVHNLAMILGFAFCGFGAYVLGMTVTRSRFASIVAGVLYAFVPYRLTHLAHIQVVWSGWLPLMLAMLLLYWRRPTNARAALFGVAVLMNGLTNVHWLLFGTVAIVITMAALALLERRELRFWIPLLISFALALLLLVPILLPYRTVSRLYAMKRDWGSAQYYSATWFDWLAASDRTPTYGHITDAEKTSPERFLFPGLLAPLLTVAAMILYRPQSREPEPPEERRLPAAVLRAIDVAIVLAAIVTYWGMVTKAYEFRIDDIHVLGLRSAETAAMFLLALICVRLSLRLPKAWWRADTPRSLRTVFVARRLPREYWMCVLWIAIGVIGSFGVNAFLHGFLFRYVEPFQALRVPARWAMIAYTGLAGAAALGAASLVEHRAGWRRYVACGFLVVATFVDIRPSVRWEHLVPEVDPVYRWLRDAPIRGGVLEVPVVRDGAQFFYMLNATEHHRPIMNGISGFEPPVHVRIREQIESAPIPLELIETLENNGAQLVIVHEDWLREFSERVRDWLRHELTGGRLGFVRRFDHKTAGDWVFAVTKNLPEWRILVPPVEPDGAGHLPDQALARMLAGETNYMSRAFGFVDWPRYFTEIRGPLTVSGWIVSPHAIRSVDVLMHDARRRFRTDFVDRSDVRHLYPWYPQGHVVGFTTTIPRRPRGVPARTELQVEVTDARGVKTRLPDTLITWQ
jgi:hypothetical protein